jgi:hypothetical protein
MGLVALAAKQEANTNLFRLVHPDLALLAMATSAVFWPQPFAPASLLALIPKHVHVRAKVRQ